jgi:hypothetical protein
MNQSNDLSGIWEGFYTQHDQERPIAATLEQEGTHLIGEMTDGCTELEASISEYAMSEGLPPGADEQIVEKIREAHPDAPPGPVMAEAELPPHSVLEGEVEGEKVRFVKTYQGEQFAGFRIGAMRVRWKVNGRQVHYQGLVSRDGNAIEGRWRIQGGLDPETHAIRTEGGFFLKRAKG